MGPFRPRTEVPNVLRMLSISLSCRFYYTFFRLLENQNQKLLKSNSYAYQKIIFEWFLIALNKKTTFLLSMLIILVF